MNAHRVMGIVGWKNSGKTTLVEALVRTFVAQGIRVSTVKHAHHTFDIDTPGKDSHRHRTAGASEVLVASRSLWALVHELRDECEPTLDELLSHLSPCDLVLVEGFKSGSHPMIEVVRHLPAEGLLASQIPAVCAIATDMPILDWPGTKLPLNEPEHIAAFILRHVGIAQ